jgi:histidinol-phosphate phosphatase family protein
VGQATQSSSGPSYSCAPLRLGHGCEDIPVSESLLSVKRRLTTGLTRSTSVGAFVAFGHRSRYSQIFAYCDDLLGWSSAADVEVQCEDERGETMTPGGAGHPNAVAQVRRSVSRTSLSGHSAATSQVFESTRRPGVLLDRDGTIIVDHGYVGSVDRVELIDGAPAAIAGFNAAGIPVAVVTNQAGVARGLYGIDDVTRVHQFMVERLAAEGARIDAFLFCPYHPDGVVPAFARTSEDRKPRPGMARAAEVALNLDLAASWVVGDRAEDVGLAEVVGASAVYLGPGICDRPGVFCYPSLAAAAPFILERIAA